MEEDKLNEYNEIMSQEEDDSGENVYIDEEENYQENIIGEEVEEIGKIKKDSDLDEGDDFYNDNEIEDTEEEEKEEEELEEEKEEEELEEEKPKKIKTATSKKKKVKKASKKKAKKASTKKKASKKKAKKASTKKKASKKKTKKKKNSFWSTFLPLLGILVIIGAIFFMNNYSINFNQNQGIAAIVNGEEISTEYLNEQYDLFFLIGGIPEEYKTEITKERFLEETLISEIVILQQAKNSGIEVVDQEINDFLTESREQNGMSEEVFNQNLQDQGLELEELKEYLYKQLVSFKLLNQTIFKDITVEESEIENIYQSNKEMFDLQDQTYEDIKQDIEDMLLADKQTSAARLYVNGLVASADIEIYYNTNKFSITKKTSTDTNKNTNIFLEETSSTFTFEETGDELCTENGKPLVILFSTTTCPHCEWIGDTFDNSVKEYVEQEKIIAYHWQLDLGDNLLTDALESTIPQKHIDLITKYDPQGYVPMYIFGCKYTRIGNGYEKEENLFAEELEFKTLIGKLI